MTDNSSGLERLIGSEVVLDTAGLTIYLGTLREIRPDGLWLEDADVRDQAEGHVTKERYICEAKQHGICPNRRRVFVRIEVVLSCSALADILID